MTQKFQSDYHPPQTGFVPLLGNAPPMGFSAVRMPSVRPLADEPAPPPPPTPEQLLQAAREQAEKIVEAALGQTEERARQAEAEAREEQVLSFQAASAALLQDMREQVQETLQRLEREAAGLVGEIVRRVTAEHFQAQPEAIVPVVREALQAVGESARVQVIVAPQHEAPLRQAYHDLAGVLSSDSRLEITVDEEAHPFGCVVHGEHGSFDARLDTRLQAIEQMVHETVAQQAA